MNDLKNPKTYKQLQCIWGLAHKLDLTPERLREMTKEMFPETEGHLSRLTSDQAARMINLLKEKLGQPVSPYRFGRQDRGKPRPQMSPAQKDLAFHLAKEVVSLQADHEIGNYDYEIYVLLSDLARQNGVVRFDFCNTRQAAHIIEGLKAMKNRLKNPLDKS